MFRVTRYPMISKTESGRVGYQKKYRVAGRVRVPAGHWLDHTCHVHMIVLPKTWYQYLLILKYFQVLGLSHTAFHNTWLARWTTRCHLGQPHQKVSSLHRKVTAGPEIEQTRTFLIKDRLYASEKEDSKSVKTPKSMQKYTTWQPHAVKMYYNTSYHRETKTTKAKSSNQSTTSTKSCIFKVVGQRKKKWWGSRRSSGTSWFKFSSHGKRASQLITQLVKMTHIP